MAKAPQLERKGLVMVKAMVKVKAEHRARVSVSVRVARKAPASRTAGMAKFHSFHWITKE